ncbi:hypothetical protein G6N77_17990, partial [Arthrobacter silviterrae]|nr:hypothetical protein [Arthrobacter silviterrae]
MAGKLPQENIDEQQLTVGPVKHRAVGIPGILHSMEVSLNQMGPLRTAQTLLRINQKDGFDCPGCAWPEGETRHAAEFCENGAKAVAEEATKRRVPPSFFAEHSVSELREWDDFRLGQQGRLTEPMFLAEGSEHYVPVSWEQALGMLAEELTALA